MNFPIIFATMWMFYWMPKSDNFLSRLRKSDAYIELAIYERDALKWAMLCSVIRIVSCVGLLSVGVINYGIVNGNNTLTDICAVLSIATAPFTVDPLKKLIVKW